MAVFKERTEDAIDSAIAQLQELSIYNKSRQANGICRFKPGMVFILGL